MNETTIAGLAKMLELKEMRSWTKGQNHKERGRDLIMKCVMMFLRMMFLKWVILLCMMMFLRMIPPITRAGTSSRVKMPVRRRNVGNKFKENVSSNTRNKKSRKRQQLR